jgi:hypothetical protein
MRYFAVLARDMPDMASAGVGIGVGSIAARAA